MFQQSNHDQRMTNDEGKQRTNHEDRLIHFAVRIRNSGFGDDLDYYYTGNLNRQF